MIGDDLMMKKIVLRVQGKISNMFILESEMVIGMEDQFKWIERELRENADVSGRAYQAILRETLYNLENLIDELIVKSAERRKISEVLIQVKSNLPEIFFNLFVVVDFMDCYKICNELEKIKQQIWSYYYIHRYMELDESIGLYDNLNTGNIVIFPVISKFEALATLQQLSPAAKKKVRWLRDEFESLQDFLDDVEGNEMSKEGMAWMEELSEACWLAENVIGLFLDTRELQLVLARKRNLKATFKTMVWNLHDFIFHPNLEHQLFEIKAKVFHISERRFRVIPGKSEREGSKFPLRSAASCDSVERLHNNGFDEDVDVIMAQLLKDDPRCLTISIAGVGGIGKTSLAKLVYDSQAIVDNFPYRAWVSVESYEDMLMKIVGLTDSDLDFNPQNETLEDYEERLRVIANSFFMDKKYLIVIDDFNASDRTLRLFLESAFTGISTGTRILFTVRNEVTEKKFARQRQQVDHGLVFRLHLRSDDESWSLFEHALKVNISPELQSLKQEILRKCGGLPKVIVKLGELLSQTDATLEGWSKVLEHLIQDEEPWSLILEDINRKLPLYLRRCLFYFGLFPAGYKIPTRRLIALWVAEGLGRQNNDDKSPEYVAEACLTELVNHNMVQVAERKQNGKAKTCRLPEVLRVHWFSKAKEANFLQDHSDNAPAIRRLADHLDQNDISFNHIHGNNSNSLYPYYRNAVSFLSFDTRDGSRAGEDIENFLDRCISSSCFLFLWVLDLECVYKPKLPKAAARLTQLRYLGLRSTYLEKLPAFIDKLLNLQTLDLKRTCINSLPVTIWKMQKLRHLFLDENFRSMFVPRQADDFLPDLQSLWGVLIDEDSPVKNGLDTLSNITKLGLKCKISVPSQSSAASMSSQLVAVSNWVHSLKNLQSLRLKSFDESGLPWDLYLDSLSTHMDLSNIYLVGKLKNQNFLSHLPHSLIELTLSASQLAEDPMQTLDKLPNLRILKLFSRSFVGKKMVCRSGGFIKLEVLKLWEMKLLDEWNIEEGALPVLKHLEIRRCAQLKMIPDGLRLVMSLRELKLTEVPELSSRIKDNQGEDW